MRIHLFAFMLHYFLCFIWIFCLCQTHWQQMLLREILCWNIFESQNREIFYLNVLSHTLSFIYFHTEWNKPSQMEISEGLKQKAFYLLSTDFTQTQQFVNPVQSSFWVMTALHIKAEKEMSERSFYHCYSIWKARVNIHPWLFYLHYRFITAYIPVLCESCETMHSMD